MKKTQNKSKIFQWRLLFFLLVGLMNLDTELKK